MDASQQQQKAKLVPNLVSPSQNTENFTADPGTARRRKRVSSSSTADWSSGEEEDIGDLSSCSESWDMSWSAINQRRVTEITLNFFYQPRTLTLLSLILLSLVCVAFMRPARGHGATDRESNLAGGVVYSCFLFLSIGLLVFPNGPFTRPHPALWRLVFGMSFLYFLFLSFFLFQSYEDVQAFMNWVDPQLSKLEPDSTKLYAVDCSFTVENLYSRVDIFIPAHFVGWVFKTLLVRHTGMLWTMSVLWECTELFFAHVLPNFYECWWDAILFDVLLCNALGIYVGMALCRMLEVRQFYWESIKNIKGTRGKLRRAILQFTPENWSRIRWLDRSSTSMRILAIFLLIMLFQITDLNTFLLKHVFKIPTSHYLVAIRMLLISLIGAPSVRQYYVYATDKTCKRLGTQVWVYIGIMITELLISIRFGATILPRPALMFMLGWLGVTALSSGVMVLTLTDSSGVRQRLARLWGKDPSWGKDLGEGESLEMEGSQKKLCRVRKNPYRLIPIL